MLKCAMLQNCSCSITGNRHFNRIRKCCENSKSRDFPQNDFDINNSEIFMTKGILTQIAYSDILPLLII